MNQLYHPEHTAEFFTMLAQNTNIKVYTVTNNVVHDLATFSDAEKKNKTLDGVAKFLAANRFEFCWRLISFKMKTILSPFYSLDGENIKSLCKAHYESMYSPPRKAFDVYVAVALVRFMNGWEKKERLGELRQPALPAVAKKLFYSNQYGMTLVSQCDKWDEALQTYISKIDTKVTFADTCQLSCHSTVILLLNKGGHQNKSHHTKQDLYRRKKGNVIMKHVVVLLLL